MRTLRTLALLVAALTAAACSRTSADDYVLDARVPRPDALDVPRTDALDVPRTDALDVPRTDARDVVRFDARDGGEGQCLCPGNPDFEPCVGPDLFCCPCTARCMSLLDPSLCECPPPGITCDRDAGDDAIDVPLPPDVPFPPDAMACATGVDCNDSLECTDDLCVGGRCANLPRDRDRDTHVDGLCGGDDCNDMDPRVFPGAAELCRGGVDENCNGQTDCADPACSAEPACTCVRTGPEVCTNGTDDDCDALVDCADSDCVASPACCRPMGRELGQCTDGVDNDCNGRIDCADPMCSTDGACVGCRPGDPEICDDGRDNNCDMRIDCGDPMCRTLPRCRMMCTPESCADGLDNDCNFLVDCADLACTFDPHCTCRAEVCDNATDDDCDTLIDCFDTDCRPDARCIARHESCNIPLDIGTGGTFRGNTLGFADVERASCGGAGAGEAVFQFTLTRPSRVALDTRGSAFDSALYVRTGNCRIGRELACDDDSGGGRAARIVIPILYPGTYFVFVDGYTTGNAGAYAFNATITPEPPEVCNNGLDDDGDRLVDCADPGCAGAPGCAGCSREFGATACTDGRDNDCDRASGFPGVGLDCMDTDCHASTTYDECCDGRDDNGNGIVDEFACRCATDADCRAGYVCYTATTNSCGPPCDRFFGDICESTAPGSRCDAASGQCQF